MDVLIVEPIEPELLQWLESRQATRYAPQLEADPLALRQALFNARALLASPAVAVDAAMLQAAPLLRVVGSMGLGIEHIDIEACARHGVDVVRPGSASATAEAEFAVGAMLQLLRRVPIRAADGALVGRELGGASVGLLGMSAAARPLAALLGAFGAQVSGYDPALHRSDGLWQRWAIEPVSLRDLFEKNDVVCVLLSYFSRYKGLLGERHLASLQAGAGAGQSGALEPVRRQRAGRGAGLGTHGGGVVRQHRTGLARTRSAIAHDAELPGHAAGGRRDARIAQPQCLGGASAHRHDAERNAPRGRLQVNEARRSA